MKIITDIRKSVSESSPMFAAVGVTDLAVGALRTARGELAPSKLQASAQNLPNVAISKGLEVAGKAEETYSQLTTRGRTVVGAVRHRATTRDLLAQAKSARSLGKAAVTTARKASDDTLAAAKATVTVGRRELGNLVGPGSEVREDVTQVPADVAKATKDTRKAAKRTTTTARTRTAKTATAAKRARTATARTATKSGAAAKGAARTLGR